MEKHSFSRLGSGRTAELKSRLEYLLHKHGGKIHISSLIIYFIAMYCLRFAVHYNGN